MGDNLAKYLPPTVYERLTQDARDDFNRSLRAALLGQKTREPTSPGAARISALLGEINGYHDAGRDEALAWLCQTPARFSFLSVLAITWIDPWLCGGDPNWEFPDLVYRRLFGAAEALSWLLKAERNATGWDPLLT
jgi:hypothetical protein